MSFATWPGCPVLLHSIGLSHVLWDEVLALLPASEKVLTPNSLGHGGRGATSPISLGGWTADLAAQIDAAGLDEVDLIGLSLGGIQAMHFAAWHPERVRSLVVADSFAFLPDDVALARVQSISQRIAALGMEDYADAYLDETLCSSQPPERLAELAGAIAQMGEAAYMAAAQACFTADVRTDLQHIDVPTLVLVGELDQKTPVSHAQVIARGIRNARIETIPEAGHLACVDNPAGFVTAVAGFLHELETTTHTHRKEVRL